MDLFEFQGKRLFEEKGIPVPRRKMLASPEEVKDIGFPAVIKAQVLSGGRGKAGGVRLCGSVEEGLEAAEHILGMSIGGKPVVGLLAEEAVDIEREYYISVTIPPGVGKAMIMFSSAGGMEIEKVASEDPGKIHAFYVDSFEGIRDYQIRSMGKTLNCGRVKELGRIVRALYRTFCDNDALLVEINPLVDTPEGLVALDAKVSLDDNAFSRHEELYGRLGAEAMKLQGTVKNEKKDTITYVPLENGSVGLISDGAGTGMLSLDLIRDAGGDAACFCEMGGFTSPEVMYSAMEKVLKDPKVRSLLVVLIGGFNRMDEMAEGMVRYKTENGLPVPIVVRMCGTLETEGRRIMNSADLPVYRDLPEAVKASVEMAGRR